MRDYSLLSALRMQVEENGLGTQTCKNKNILQDNGCAIIIFLI